MKREMGSGKSIVAGLGEGSALVSEQAFSFWGDLDPVSGKVINPRSNLAGESIKGKVFVYPRGRGSSTTSAVLLEAVRCCNAPSAIVSVDVEHILALGAIVAQELYDKTVPILAISEDIFRQLQTGDHLIVDAAAGKLYRVENS